MAQYRQPKRGTRRIDTLLVELGMADSQSRAQALVMSGLVLADEKRVEKPSESFSDDITIRVKGDVESNRFVSRAGLKLEHALSHFEIDPSGMTCIDIGSSTGGFTDCLLQKGAVHVSAIDSGTNQMVWQLRNDDRVDLREKNNARNLKPSDFDFAFDLAVVDVSFISATKILPAIFQLLKRNGKAIVLIKPQFEVRKGEVGKGGIVREPEKHERVVNEVNESALSVGFKVSGLTDSPILGAEGNKEFLALYER